MIDGIKTYDTKVNPDRLEQNPYLSEYWNTTVHNADAVVKYGIAEYLGLKFQIKHQKVRMQGSLHKYRNNGKHNYDDFTVIEVGKIVQELSDVRMVSFKLTVKFKLTTESHPSVLRSKTLKFPVRLKVCVPIVMVCP